MLDGTRWFECRCGMEEHTLRFTMDLGKKGLQDDGAAIYAEIHLTQWRRWWQRAWTGLKYIMGYRCRYGHFACWIMQDEDVERLRNMCDEFLSRKEE